VIPLRVSSEQEALGLDLSQHGEMMEGSAPAEAIPVLAKTA
jgi:hypothetical protein